MKTPLTLLKPKSEQAMIKPDTGGDEKGPLHAKGTPYLSTYTNVDAHLRGIDNSSYTAHAVKKKVIEIFDKGCRTGRSAVLLHRIYDLSRNYLGFCWAGNEDLHRVAKTNHRSTLARNITSLEKSDAVHRVIIAQGATSIRAMTPCMGSSVKAISKRGALPTLINQLRVITPFFGYWIFAEGLGVTLSPKYWGTQYFDDVLDIRLKEMQTRTLVTLRNKWRKTVHWASFKISRKSGMTRVMINNQIIKDYDQPFRSRDILIALGLSYIEVREGETQYPEVTLRVAPKQKWELYDVNEAFKFRTGTSLYTPHFIFELADLRCEHAPQLVYILKEFLPCGLRRAQSELNAEPANPPAPLKGGVAAPPIFEKEKKRRDRKVEKILSIERYETQKIGTIEDLVKAEENPGNTEFTADNLFPVNLISDADGGVTLLDHARELEVEPAVVEEDAAERSYQLPEVGRYGILLGMKRIQRLTPEIPADTKFTSPLRFRLYDEEGVPHSTRDKYRRPLHVLVYDTETRLVGVYERDEGYDTRVRRAKFHRVRKRTAALRLKSAPLTPTDYQYMPDLVPTAQNVADAYEDDEVHDALRYGKGVNSRFVKHVLDDPLAYRYAALFEQFEWTRKRVQDWIELNSLGVIDLNLIQFLEWAVNVGRLRSVENFSMTEDSSLAYPLFYLRRMEADGLKLIEDYYLTQVLLRENETTEIDDQDLAEAATRYALNFVPNYFNKLTPTKNDN